MTTTWPAPGKLNLFLYITGRRPDGYHTLQTLFQFLASGDTLTITPQEEKPIQLLTPLPSISYEDNLIIKAAQLLQQTTGCRQGAMISVHKQLPLGSGLGGGSSNAATTLAALNQLWGCGLSLAELQQLGVTLGADIPLFLYGKAAFAEGIGNQLQPADPKELWYLVAYPEQQISTAQLFNHPHLKRSTPQRTLKQCLTSPYANDCEEIVKKCFPEVERVIEYLLRYAPARLTGTGSAAFAEFSSQTEAQQVFNRMPTGVNAFVTRGVNHSPLQQALANYAQVRAGENV
jgi:4-diphosphocytidyl-2-C-methyl-D-erythritol kinase